MVANNLLLSPCFWWDPKNGVGSLGSGDPQPFNFISFYDSLQVGENMIISFLLWDLSHWAYEI